MNIIKLTRYIWAYLGHDRRTEAFEMQLWTSPDQDAERLEIFPTPFSYQLTRNDVRYFLHSEVQLSEAQAIRIAGLVYEQEFVIAPKMKMKRMR